ncbi:glycosyltransferase family 39 protein [Rhodonellum sp.]|uniref:ArnT family glycosyltransferase n=1 Tax=Rhodonellum sp. TaxID=2231180 RepID=UPI00271CF8DC|nr:phospholipid carrier-dependent glycosyltransferase [Rhodonellum sp.]MDO9552292.1 phospholipid carrier-dependent glycosyltransferase [Rhodonellum sp.]
MQPDKRFSIWYFMLVFAFLVGPFALSFHMHYPDEMYYTDAAVKMLQTGDIHTPFLGSDEMRFKKPILTYWFVLAGFELFGVTPFGSRIFFLLAGALTVGFVYWGASVFFKDSRVTKLSALIMASHPVLILSATRSIPDVLLGMFLAMSAVGFLGYLRHGNDAPKKYSWLLFLGLALAFEVKGLPAAALGGLGLFYLLVNPWQRIKIQKLAYLPALLTAVFVAFYWFVAMYAVHGADYLESFVEDQVGMRVASRHLLVIQNVLLATLLMVVMFLPWFIFGAKGFKNKFKELFNHDKAFTGFVVVWVIAILLMSAVVSKFYERYLLPVVPLTSIWVAWLLIQNGILERVKLLKGTLIFFLALNSLVLLIGIFFNLMLPSGFWIWIQVLIAAGILFYLIGRSRSERALPKAIAISVMLLFFEASISTYQISLPDAGQLIKIYTKEQGIMPGSKIAYLGHLHTGSKIRIGLGPDYLMTDLGEENFGARYREFDFLILEEKHLDKLPDTGYEMELAALNWDAKYLWEMVKSLWNGNPEEVKNQLGKKFFWIKPL